MAAHAGEGPKGGPIFPNPDTAEPYADLRKVEHKIKLAADLDSRPYDWYRPTFTTRLAGWKSA